MATKRLERTVIEGGRDGWSKHARWDSHGTHRVREREWLTELVNDPRAWEHTHAPSRKPVYRSFADKLGPAGRWLDRQCGRPWREVWGDILRTFDTRTLAGRHIVFDHLLPPAVRYDGVWRVGRWSFRIDDGVLIGVHGRVRRHGPWVRCAMRRWIADRHIGVRGQRAYWMVAVGAPDPTGRVWYRQGRALSKDEMARLADMNEAEREAFVHELE